MSIKHLYTKAHISNDVDTGWHVPDGFNPGDAVAVEYSSEEWTSDGLYRDVFKVTAATGEVAWLYERALYNFSM